MFMPGWVLREATLCRSPAPLPTHSECQAQAGDHDLSLTLHRLMHTVCLGDEKIITEGFTSVLHLFQSGLNDAGVFRRRTTLHPKAVGARMSHE